MREQEPWGADTLGARFIPTSPPVCLDVWAAACPRAKGQWVAPSLLGVGLRD